MFQWHVRGHGAMSSEIQSIDRRLLGTWQSDRRKTFRQFAPRSGTSPEAVRQLRAMFGKLVVRWTPKRCFSEFDGTRSSVAYEVVATDPSSVVVRYFNTLLTDFRLRHLHFEGKLYWVSIGGLREYFKRLK